MSIQGSNEREGGGGAGGEGRGAVSGGEAWWVLYKDRIGSHARAVGAIEPHRQPLHHLQ